MSADSPENSGTDSENDAYDPATLRSLVPSTLGSEGTRALVCAIRNPDASTAQVAEKCGLGSTYTVEHALRSAVQEANRDGVEYGQAVELRGEARDAESYAELTDKQRAIIDFAAENPTFTEDRTWADVAQAIQEQEGTVVNETYVGQVLRKYPQILHRQRALAASEGEGEVALEDALSEMTMREVLEAAGFDLPAQNLDEMPEMGQEAGEQGSEQVTLGEAREAEASDAFQTGSEVQEQEVVDEAEQVPSSAYLDDGYVEQHADMPGASQAQRLPEDADESDVQADTPYWAYVNAQASYGVFVSLTNPAYGDDVSGLVAVERLYGTRHELERGDPLIVELDNRNPKGLAFTDWRLLHPDGAEQQGEGEGTEQEQEPDDEQDTPEVEQPAVPDEVQERLERLEQAVDTLREGAVFASEMREFADEVEGHFQDFNDDLEVLENRLDEVDQQVQEQLGAFRDEMKEREQEQAATSTSGPLGRVQEDVQRLAAEDATLESYSYQQQDGGVTIHVQARLNEAALEGDN